MAVPCTVSPTIEQGPVVIRQLRSITLAQAGTVARAVATLSAAWRVERHDDYDGYLSLVISQDDDDEAPTFAISGEADRIELCEVRDDALHAWGCFNTIDETADALVGMLRNLRL